MPRVGAPPPSRYWCFTWNNFPADWRSSFEACRAGINNVKIVHLAVGIEGLADGCTPHLQGYFSLTTNQRLSALKALWPSVHFEIKRGSVEEAVDYTTKEGNDGRLDWDDRPGKGHRADLDGVSAIIVANPRRGLKRVAEEQPSMFVKYFNGLTALSRILAPRPPLLVERTVHWYYGRSGCGKTFTARSEAIAAAGGDSEDVFLWNSGNLKFADFYNGQEYVIIDDLRPTWEHYSFSRLLALLGSEGGTVEVKGSSVYWCAKHIWITAPVTPAIFYDQDPRRFGTESVQQLLRRIAVTQCFDVIHPDAYASTRCLPPDVSASAAPPEPEAPRTPELLPRRSSGSIFHVRPPSFLVTESDTDARISDCASE